MNASLASEGRDTSPSDHGAIDQRRDVVLTFVSGALAGQRFEFFDPPRLVLGRSKDCELEVFDQRVSRRHCSLTVSNGAVEVKDLGSANGTYLNGRAIEIALLKTGDVIRLGDTLIRIELGSVESTVKLRRSDFTRPRIDGTESVASMPGIELMGVLGVGATSAVYTGRRTSDGQLVAVKVLRLRESLVPEDRARFRREAEMAASLRHPNIVRVLGHGEANGRPYIVQELVRGENVEARLKRLGPMPVAVALHVARQIAAALEHARLHGIVHRDVKPGNILIQEDGVAKLVDFGLAKLVGGEAHGLTRSGDVLGTLAYMSPEQLESPATADHRADIYSLGASLFHMIAGRTPFQAKTAVLYFDKIFREEAPALATIRAGVPPFVNALVARCLMKAAVDRYETAAHVEAVANRLLSSDEDRNTAA